MYIEDNNIWVIIGLVIVVSLWSIKSSIDNSRSEMERINVTLNKIANQIGVPYTIIEIIDDDEFKNLISKGKKIKAIKRYKTLTEDGLQKSKEYVESIIKQELK
ncbi:50S ribosomal protein L7/L12 [Clostridium sp.]|uniref:50S ribosomal protein L7/L12 n=1 Tax=Clostridium sp. TaxID=1506 RepID=UPI003D6C78F4